MKNMTNSAKFLIVCAVIFALGLVMTIGGCAAGGVKGLEDTLDGNGLADSAPAEMEVVEGDYEFSSIEATGCADFVIAGSRYYSDVLEDDDLSGRDIEAKAGKVIVIYDKNNEEPKVKNEAGKLIIEAPKDNTIDISFDNDNYYAPTVIVLCGDEELDSIKISSEACDADVKGAAFKNADIQTNAGDIDLQDVMSGGIKIVDDAGDVDISGVLKGTTEVKNEAGEIDVDTFDDPSVYSMEIQTNAGEVEIGENEIEGGRYSQKGGENLLKLFTDAGDISVGKM